MTDLRDLEDMFIEIYIDELEQPEYDSIPEDALEGVARAAFQRLLDREVRASAFHQGAVAMLDNGTSEPANLDNPFLP